MKHYTHRPKHTRRRSATKKGSRRRMRGGLMALTPAYIDSKSPFNGVSGPILDMDPATIIDGQGVTNYGVGAAAASAGQAGGSSKKRSSKKGSSKKGSSKKGSSKKRSSKKRSSKKRSSKKRSSKKRSSKKRSSFSLKNLF